MNKVKRKNPFLDKENRISIISAIILLTIYVIFAVALFIRQDIMSYISASLLFVALVWNMIRPLTKKGRIGIPDWIDIGFSFIPTVILLVIFIAILPDDVKTVMTAIVASTISGLLTLFGVALTIKYNRIEKEEDEIKKIKPYIFPISDDTWNSIPSDKKSYTKLWINPAYTVLKKQENIEGAITFEPIMIVNTDLAMCTFYGIMVNDYLIKFDYERVILKNSYQCFELNIPFQLNEEVKSISLLLKDMLANPYEAKTHFAIHLADDGKTKEIMIISILGINPIKN